MTFPFLTDEYAMSRLFILFCFTWIMTFAAEPVMAVSLIECLSKNIKLQHAYETTVWNDIVVLFQKKKLGDGNLFQDNLGKGIPKNWATLYPSKADLSHLVVAARAENLLRASQHSSEWRVFASESTQMEIASKLQSHLEKGGRVTDEYLKEEIDPLIKNAILAFDNWVEKVQHISSHAAKTERISYASKLLGRTFSDKEAEVLDIAHWIGLGEIGADGKSLAQVGNFSKSQLKAKAELLKQAGFSQKERKLLMQKYVVGFDLEGFMNTMASMQLRSGDLSGSFETTAWRSALRGDALGALTSSALSDAARSFEGGRGVRVGGYSGGGPFSYFSTKDVGEELRNAAHSIGALSKLSSKGNLTLSTFQEHVKSIGEYLNRAKLKLENLGLGEDVVKIEAIQKRIEKLSDLLRDKKFVHGTNTNTISEIAELTIKEEKREELMFNVKFFGGLIAVTAGLAYVCFEYGVCLAYG